MNPAAKGEYIVLKALTEAKHPIDSVERGAAADRRGLGVLDRTGRRVGVVPGAVPGGEGQGRQGDRHGGRHQVGRQHDHRRPDAVLQEHPEVVQKFLEVTKDLTRRQRENPAAFENVFEQAGPRALSGQRLDDAIALGGQVTDFRYPDRGRRGRSTVGGRPVLPKRRHPAAALTAADLTFDLQGAVASKEAGSLTVTATLKDTGRPSAAAGLELETPAYPPAARSDPRGCRCRCVFWCRGAGRRVVDRIRHRPDLRGRAGLAGQGVGTRSRSCTPPASWSTSRSRRCSGPRSVSSRHRHRLGARGSVGAVDAR